MPPHLSRATPLKVLLVTSAVACLHQMFPEHAHAQSVTQINSMERQILLLQSQLKQMKIAQTRHEHDIAETRTMARHAREQMEDSNPYELQRAYAKGAYPVDTPAPYGAALAVRGVPAYAVGKGVQASHSGPQLKQGEFQVGGVTIRLGGFLESAGIYRSRNQAADISSNFSGIPWENSPNAHMNEYHQTERQSRFTALVKGNVSDNIEASAYVEMDFQGAGSSSNSRESNSYVLRDRVFYGEIDDKADDLSFVGGQMWSLATMFKKGMAPRDITLPAVIDAQYVPGFTWLRNTGVRIVKGFDHSRYHLGLEIANPQAIIGVGSGGTYKPNGATSVTVNTTGGNVNNPDTTYSTDVAPDVVIKGTADPGYGHYEAFGVGRFLHDRVSYLGNGTSHTAFGGGGGGGMILPIVGDKLAFRASGMAGYGIGRYATSGLPDYTLNARGGISLLPEAQVLIGLESKPTKALQVYAYGGMEDILSRSSFNAGGKAYGYGNPNYNVTGCNIEGAAASLCQASTRRVVQGTLGFWYNWLHGDYGTVKVGAQYSYTNMASFSGVGGTPHTDDNMVFFSFRYYPFE